VSQPRFSLVAAAAEVRPTAPTATPELGRQPKAGLQRHAASSPFAGTPAPGEGFALTLAVHACAVLSLPDGVDRHDVQTAVALVAAKRASLAGRAPTIYDVRAVIELLGLTSESATNFSVVAGLSHSYAAQRRFVDAVSTLQLFPVK